MHRQQSIEQRYRIGQIPLRDDERRRGNLLILAPPLVIGEQDLADAMSLLDRLLAAHFPNKGTTT